MDIAVDSIHPPLFHQLYTMQTEYINSIWHVCDETTQLRWIAYSNVLRALRFSITSISVGAIGLGVRTVNRGTSESAAGCCFLHSDCSSEYHFIHVFRRFTSRLWKQRATKTPPRSRTKGSLLINWSRCWNSLLTHIRNDWNKPVQGVVRGSL